MNELIVKVGTLRENSYNPNEMDPEKYAALKASMAKDGQLQTIIVRKFMNPEEAGHRFEIIDGAHRFRIAKELKWSGVRVQVQDVDEQTAMRLCYKVNEARGELDFFKQAIFFEKLRQAKLDVGDISKEYGVSSSFVKDRLKLNSINQEQRELLEKNGRKAELDVHVWKAYASCSPEERIEFAKRVKFEQGQFDAERCAQIAKRAVQTQHQLQDAVKKAVVKTCPKCGKSPRSLNYSGNLQCEACHDWNPSTGKTPQQSLAESRRIDKTGSAKAAPKSKYPRKQTVDVHFDQVVETATKKILANLESIQSISFRGKDGLDWAVTFGDKDCKHLSLQRSRPDKQADHFDFEEDVFEKTGPLLKCPPTGPVDDKMNAQLHEWAKWLGAKVIEKCRKCGCTEDKACAGGCTWVKPGLCSKCAKK